jgi:hypothetical protein
LTSDHAVERPAMPAPTTMMFMCRFSRGWFNSFATRDQHTVWNATGKPR